LRLKRIRGHNFQGADDFEVELAPTGITMVTGNNGGNKSAIWVDSVCAALWRQTVRQFDRGTTPWRDDGEIWLEAEIDGKPLIVHRTAETLRWGYGEPPRGYETATKAQAELERLVGPADAFMKANVIDCRQTGFSTLPDRARKELLEALLGVDRFETAEAAARLHTKVLEDRHRTAGLEIERLRERTEAAQRAIADFDTQMAALESISSAKLETAIAAATARHTAAREARKVAEAAAAQNRDAYQKAQTEWRASVLNAERVARELSGSVGAAICPTCKRPFQEADAVAHLRDEIQKARQALETARRAEPERPSETALLKVFGDEQQAAEELRNLEVRRSGAALRDRVGVQRETRVRELSGLRLDLEDAELEATGLDRTLKVQYGVENVLGPRGARAILLADAVSALEPIANEWLARLGDLRVAIQPFRTQKNGNAVDTITLSVSGGGQTGYGGCSGGQQRRIDVALALALSEMARATSRGFDLLVLDEACDSPLDREGREGLLVVLKEMSSNRQIVIITHSQPVMEALAGCPHYHAAAGKIERVS
jgi:DNA repair exonuclease SbcCD ATPase subunit